ncbi:APC family permease [Nocardia tengchongensis]|uniref:APC family permease n=1 Tax=Nocardia tengchongensis TaxID=2055889 RepID=UPI0036A2C472
MSASHTLANIVRVTINIGSGPSLGAASVSEASPAEVPGTGEHGADTRRDFSLSSVFGVAFAFISPIIALYTIFNLGLGIAGASFWWAFLVVLIGQLLVALVFGELSSRWPEEGGVYAWARRLVGRRFGWCTGWVYAITLITLNAAGAFAASSFAATLFDVPEAGTALLLGFAIGFIALATSANVLSRRTLKVFITASLVCEVIGSLFVGTVLLMFHRHNDFSVLMSGFRDGGMDFATGPFLAAVAVVGWALIGFESAGDLAAEVKRPERNVPLAQIGSLVLVALTVMYAGLALILAIPDLDTVATGQIDDAIIDTLTTNLGPGVVVPICLVVCIGFTAGITAVSATLSRIVHAMATSGSLPASRLLVRLSAREGVPRFALALTSLATAALLLLSVLIGFHNVMISMSTGGFYIAFFLPVAAMLILRIKGMWASGEFNLGPITGFAVNAAAALWLLAEIINISWPRSTGQPWFVEWGCLLMYTITGAVGALLFRRYAPSTRKDTLHA